MRRAHDDAHGAAPATAPPIEADGRLAGVVTWELVHDLQEAADMARGMGRDAMSERLSHRAEVIARILNARIERASSECTSHFWIG
jgi:hypothetical protein